MRIGCGRCEARGKVQDATCQKCNGYGTVEAPSFKQVLSNRIDRLKRLMELDAPHNILFAEVLLVTKACYLLDSNEMSRVVGDHLKAAALSDFDLSVYTPEMWQDAKEKGYFEE